MNFIDRPYQARAVRRPYCIIYGHAIFHSPVLCAPRRMRCLVPRPPPSNPGNEEAGEREHVLGVSICPVSTVSKWLTVSKWWTIPTLNRKELEMQRSELLWSLSGTHTFFFFRLPCHCRVQQSFNLVNVLISKNFTRQIDRLTDGQNRLLNPFAHARAG